MKLFDRCQTRLVVLVSVFAGSAAVSLSDAASFRGRGACVCKEE
jgi:hypothetical protein